MFRWTKNMISFREDAAVYNQMEEKLVDILVKYIPYGAYVCDVGCGLGFLSIELAKRGYKVTAVDTDEDVLNILRRNAEKNNLTNIEILHDDIFKLRNDKKYDVMIFCFFGNTEEALQVLKNNCKGKGLLIKKDFDTHRFALRDEGIKKLRFTKTCTELSNLQIPFKSETFTLDIGQPFRSFADAKKFFTMYNNNGAVHNSMIECRLKRIDNNEFTYYMPCERQLGLIALNSRDIPDYINN